MQKVKIIVSKVETIEKKRIDYIDVARGIAIICIILGHLKNPEINRFVYTFHVPLFFLISGFFFDIKSKTWVFIIKKTKTLLVPYVICCGLIILFAVIVEQIMNPEAKVWETIALWLQASLYGAGDSYLEPFVINKIGPIWFLLALFWANIFLHFLLKTRPVIRAMSVLLFFFLACVSTGLFWFPFSIQASGPALLYMYIGYCVKKNETVLRNINREDVVFISLIALGIWIEFIINFQRYWLVHCNMGRGVIDFLGSLCGCWCILVISWLISKIEVLRKLFSFLGYYSILMLCAHSIENNTFYWGELINGIFPGIDADLYFCLKIAGKLLWAIGITMVISKIKIARRAFGFS